MCTFNVSLYTVAKSHLKKNIAVLRIYFFLIDYEQISNNKLLNYIRETR